MRALEIAVAGCGPGGLAAALLLHRDGHRVTIFERFDTPRPLGSGLMIQPTGLAVLHLLGLGSALAQCAAPIERLFGKTVGSDSIALDVRYAALGKQGLHGLGTHRGTLFALLHEAALAAGIVIETGCDIISSELASASRRRLHFEAGTSAGPFDLVVDASGSRSKLVQQHGKLLRFGALWANLDWPETSVFSNRMLEQRYSHASRMAGVMPMGSPPGDCREQAAFFWSLPAADVDAWRETSLDRWKEEVLSLWPETTPLLAQIKTHQQLTFASYAHRTVNEPVSTGLIHIGDAWHATSPQLGQGANMALLDAAALSHAMAVSQTVADALRHMLMLRKRHILLYQTLSSLFTPFYQSDSRVLPLLRDIVLGPLSRIKPIAWLQAAMVSGLLGNPLKRLGLPLAFDDHIC